MSRPADRRSARLPLALALGLLLTVGGASVAHAQIAGVLARPRVPRTRTDSARGDSVVRPGRTTVRIPADERQRLGIQAWVDSAAPALAQAAPTPIPAPAAGSIFDGTPAVPDSLRPPPAPVPRARGRRSRGGVGA